MLASRPTLGRPNAKAVNGLSGFSRLLRPILPLNRVARISKLTVASIKIDPEAKQQDLKTRSFRRTVYDFDNWTKHRRISRYTDGLITLPSSRIIRTLSQPLGVVLVVSAVVGIYHTFLESGVLPEFLPKFTLTTPEPQGLTSFALSLLLVFRTNSSYGRFDEARKIWGGILNRARNLGNQAVTFIPAEDEKGREAVAKWTVGFCQALRAHLQEDANLRTELSKCQPRWTPEEIEMIATAQHKPIKAISMLSELTRQLDINQFQALQMQENVQFFYDALGGCERLLRTPIPVSYTRHTARFLIIWLSLLPLGLWERYHWSMVPIIMFVGFLLLGIDEIGVQIEEPFGILPLDVICKRAETDVNSLLKEDTQVASYLYDYRDGKYASRMDELNEEAAPPAAVIAAPAASSMSAAASITALASAAAAASPKSNGAAASAAGFSMPSLPNPFSGLGAAKPAAAPAAPQAEASKPLFSLPTLPAMPNLGKPAGNGAKPAASNARSPSSSSNGGGGAVRAASPRGIGRGSASASRVTSPARGVAATMPANWRDELGELRSSTSSRRSSDAPSTSSQAGMSFSMGDSSNDQQSSTSYAYTPSDSSNGNGNGDGREGSGSDSEVDEEAAARFGRLAGSRSPVRSNATRSDWRGEA